MIYKIDSSPDLEVGRKNEEDEWDNGEGECGRGATRRRRISKKEAEEGFGAGDK